MMDPAKSAAPVPAVSDSPKAPFTRIKLFLKSGLAEGRWPPGIQMPSEADLVAQFGVSRMTVNRALRELQSEGLIQRVQGLGTFAAQLDRVASTLTIRDIHAEIESRGHRHEANVHVQREETAGTALAAQLGVAVGAAVFHTLIVHYENGVSLQCEDRYVNPEASLAYLQHDFTRTTPTRVLFDSTSLWRAQYQIESMCATREESRLLGIAATDPCLIITRRTFTAVQPITIARLVHPGSRFNLQGEFTP